MPSIPTSLNTTDPIATASSSWWVGGPRGTRPWTGHVALQGRRRYYRVGHPALSNVRFHHQDNSAQPDTQYLHRSHRRLELSPHVISPSIVHTFGAIGQGVIHGEALDAVGLGRLPAAFRAEGDRPRRPGSIPGSGDRGVKISNQNNNGGGLTLRARGVPLCEPFDSAFWKALTHPFPPRRGLTRRTLRMIHTLLRLAPRIPLTPGACSWQRRRTGDVVLAVTTRTRPRLMLQLQAECCREDASCRIQLGQIATNHVRTTYAFVTRPATLASRLLCFATASLSV
ncbi:hypothetical protein KVR01_009744 [Diaporthe batatas]|uniref:uncharacterized protein n=1 Tax=Diaporthe batatas TaxID=748121 RepID=UPI001D05BDA5|nr:uncharacterized protein KVR01_009744 [Diaporthe batatas]KAG8160208.1 hypothetical protein KVR01_009744 [Diaporthe batatas]